MILQLGIYWREREFYHSLSLSLPPSLSLSPPLSLSLSHSLARSQSYSDGLVEIFTQYGDHLYRLITTTTYSLDINACTCTYMTSCLLVPSPSKKFTQEIIELIIIVLNTNDQCTNIFFCVFVTPSLYSKGDYDGAITQYKLTIGTLEPSYVIRKVRVVFEG